MKQTKHVKMLITRRMSIIAIPPNGNIYDGIRFLSNPQEITRVAEEATKWVENAIQVIKLLPGQPYGKDDDKIAYELLLKINATGPTPSSLGD